MEQEKNLIPLVVYVDVDDTLIRSVGSKRIPVPATIEHVRTLHAQGAELYCWSAGGAVYAQKSAEECGLGGCFKGYLPKPQVLIDDRKVSEWPRCLTVHPMECGESSVEAYWQKLG